MAINVEDYGALDIGSGRRRLQTDARQGRWLYELEHAMLQGAKKPAQQGEPQRDAVLTDEPQILPGERKGDAAWRRAQNDMDSGQQPVMPSQAPMASSAMPAPTESGAISAAAAEPSQQASTVKGEKVIGIERAAPATATSKASPPATVAGTLSPNALPVAMQAQQEQPAIPPAYLAAALTTEGKAGMKAAVPAANGTTQPVTPTKTAAAAVLEVSLSSPQPASWQSEAVLALAEEPPASLSARPALPHNEEYAQRLLHVYRDGAEVQAWVRDTALTQLQTQLLAQNLAGELGSTGAQLAALTVNGKRVVLGRAEKNSSDTDGYMDEKAPGEQESCQQPALKINANGAF